MVSIVLPLSAEISGFQASLGIVGLFRVAQRTGPHFESQTGPGHADDSPHSLLHEPVRVHCGKSSKCGAGGHTLFQANQFVVGGKVGGLVDISDRDGHPCCGLERHLDSTGQGRLVGHHYGQHEGAVQLVVHCLEEGTSEPGLPEWVWGWLSTLPSLFVPQHPTLVSGLFWVLANTRRERLG